MNGNPVILILIGQFFAVAVIKRLTLQKRLVSTLSDITKVTVQYILVIRSVAYKRTTLINAESKPTEYTTALHRGPLKYCKMNNNRPNKKRRTNRMKSPEEIPAIAAESVLVKSEKMADDAVTVKGYDFNRGVDYHELLQSYTRTGFQAHHFGKAVEEINRMISCKLEAIPEDKRQVVNMNPCKREQTNCTIFLSYTSNMISSGVRETLRYLVEHNMVDCIVTTAGGIEEDIIKCLAHMYLGDFKIPGKDLRQRGINRTGNLLCPNDNYCKFEDWIMPVLDDMLEEQEAQGTNWTPSKMIARLGKEIDNPESVCYWAYKNNIPIFSPALTDGSVGDMLYFHSYKNPGLRLDLIEDVRRMNNQAVYAVNTGMIILGGGVIKHHVCNANMMRNGADFAVYVNTAQEFDGSDAGASPDEAVSWGKIRATAKPVKVHGDATIIFPLLVAETFARNFPTTTTTKSSKAD